MTHSFDVDVAVEYGVDQAIVIANFQYWITHNAANKKNLYRGKYWTYNSHKALSIIFPYYSEKQIRRILSDLTDKMVLETDTFNQHEYDKTKWYSFVNEQRWIKVQIKGGAQTGTGCPIVPVIPSAQTGEGVPKQAPGSAQMGEPIPLVNNTDGKPNSKQKNVNSVEPPGSTLNFPADEAHAAGAAGNAPPVAPPPQLAIKGLYPLLMDTYWNWHILHIGVTPKLSKSEGSKQGIALKEIMIYLVSQAKRKCKESGIISPTDDEIKEQANNAWAFILQSMTDKKVDAFLCNGTKINQINSNLTNIINQIKNGTGKSFNAPAVAAANRHSDLQAELEREMGFNTGKG